MPFRGRLLHDPGAYGEPPISGRITWRVTDPAREPKTDAERTAAQRSQAIVDRARRASDARQATSTIDVPARLADSTTREDR